MNVDRLFIFNGRIKGKSAEGREFRLQRKQNPFRVKSLPVIVGNCGGDRRWDGAHLPPADRVTGWIPEGLVLHGKYTQSETINIIGVVHMEKLNWIENNEEW